MRSGRLARQVARGEQQRFADTRGDRLESGEREAACAATQQTHTAARHALVVPASLSRLPVPPALWRPPPARPFPGSGSGSLCSRLWLVHRRPASGRCAPGSRVYERIRPYTPVPFGLPGSRHTAPALACRLLARACQWPGWRASSQYREDRPIRVRVPGSARITQSLAHSPPGTVRSSRNRKEQAQCHRSVLARERAISSPQGMSLHLRSSPQCVPAAQEYTAHSRSVFSRQARDLTPNSPPPAFSPCCCHPGGSPGWLPRSVPLLARHSFLQSLPKPVPASGVPRSCSHATARTERLRHLSARPFLLPVARVTMRGLLAGYRAPPLNGRTRFSAVLPESPFLPVQQDVHTSRDDCGAPLPLLQTPAACPGRTAVSSPATGNVPHRCAAP